jgi:hypothetical protein
MCCARLLEGFRQAPFADLQQTQVVRYVRTHGPCLVPAFDEHVLNPLRAWTMLLSVDAGSATPGARGSIRSG